MDRSGAAPGGAAGCGAARCFDGSDAAFNAELLREQYRALARLGPYVHGVVIVGALAYFGTTAPTGSLLSGILLPAALIAVCLFRLVSWLNARPNVEVEALDRVRREVRVASLVGPALTLAFAVTTAVSAWQYSVVEFALALLAVWVVAAVCAICLNRIVSEFERYRHSRDGAARCRIFAPRRRVDARPRCSNHHRRMFHHSHAR